MRKINQNFTIFFSLRQQDTYSIFNKHKKVNAD